MDMTPTLGTTAGGPIPGDWDVSRLGDNCSVITKGTTPTSIGRAFTKDGIRFIKAESVSECGEILPEKLAYIDGTTNSLLRRSQLTRGDLLISIAGVLGRVGLIRDEYLPANINQALALVRLRGASNIGTRYLFHALRGPQVERQIRDITVQAAQANISLANVRDFLIPTPPPKEQRAIAEALADTDELLRGLDQLIGKKRDLKQAVEQQLLTARSRLPGFTGDWEKRRLGEICEISIGRTPTRAVPAYWGRGFPWLTIADLGKKVVAESREEITERAATEMTAVGKGTLLMSFKLSIGRLCFAGRDLYTNEAICGFNKLQADANYLYYKLGVTDFSAYGKQAVKGFTLNKESLNIIEVDLPSLEEQATIASILSDMDAEITALEERQAKTRLLKQAMTQELLTGRTRLPVAEDVAA